MDAIRSATTLADMDAMIDDYRAALTVPNITRDGLIIGGRVVLDVKEISGDKWKVVMRGVDGGSIEVAAPAAGVRGVPNPFCNRKVADRMEFWFMHTACWCDLFVGGRERRCNATSEIVNNIMKNNNMEGKFKRLVGPRCRPRCKLTPG
jgi:hypothetical protein